MSPERYCEERKALLIAYEAATRRYSQAVWELTRAAGATVYESMKAKVAEARQQSEEARERLAEHVQKHNC